MDKFFNAVQVWTEKQLTVRKAKKVAKKIKKKTVLSEALDWLDAIVFAVVVVLLVNQYFFQLFVIPSPSMRETLLEGDRVVVSKLTYGIETVIEGPKIFNARTPDRDDIITFYNPDYESKGKFFSLASTMLYMGTFGLVNLDTYEDGSPREKLLVKRAAAVAGDVVRFENGNAKIKASGMGEFQDESTFRNENCYITEPHRTIEKSTYKGYNALALINGMFDSKVTESSIPKHLIEDYENLDRNSSFTDQYGYDQTYAFGQRLVDPSDSSAKSKWALLNCGVYVPEGHILPLGDNRDNSADGRYFGPVSVDKVNGIGVLRIWPLSRFGSLLNK